MVTWGWLQKRQIPATACVRTPNFTAEINMFAAWKKNSLVPIPTVINQLYGGDFLYNSLVNLNDIKA